MPENDTFIKVTVPLLVAVATLWLTYFNNLRLAQRKERLDLVDRQLRDLYGPLLALCIANRVAYHDAFRRLYRPGGIPMWDPPKDDPENRPTADDVEAFRLWTKEVFMPANRELFRRIVYHTDLLMEESMPECLLELLAHIQAYEGLIKEWDTDKFKHNTPAIRFPGGVEEYINERYKKLKLSQAALQGNIAMSRSHWAARRSAKIKALFG